MIDIIKKVFELPIWHTLKINKIYLPTNIESIGDDRTQPGCWLNMLMMLDAAWTQVSKKFADFWWNIVHNLSQTMVQCPPLLMIRTMSNQQIRKKLSPGR